MGQEEIFKVLNYCVGKLEALEKKIDTLLEYERANEMRIRNLEARCERTNCNPGSEHTY